VAAASLPEGQATTVEALLAEADKRLYAVKASHHAEHGPAPRSGPAAPGHAVPHAIPNVIAQAAPHAIPHAAPQVAAISPDAVSARPAA
jgi:hypothetical protein